MKKQLIGAILTVLFLAALLPFASHSPDGLETVAKTLGVESKNPLWTPIVSYAATITENWYLSAFLQGSLGIMAVLLAGFLLGEALKPGRNPERT